MKYTIEKIKEIACNNKGLFLGTHPESEEDDGSMSEPVVRLLV